MYKIQVLNVVEIQNIMRKGTGLLLNISLTHNEHFEILYPDVNAFLQLFGKLRI